VAVDTELLQRLRAGDEEAFVALVDRYHAPLLRFAMTMVPSRAVAEEVVQDTWLGVVRGIDRFEGRSSLQTWLFRILANRARTTGTRERRSTPIDLQSEPAVPAHRFSAAGGWVDPPAPWTDEVEDRLLAQETAERVRGRIDALPEGQRQVVSLRDVDGLSAAETCEILGLTDANQRVLLHRGRSRVRGMLEHDAGEG
jgi:RNA polymerase sigma-70 factor (ECF subfamily)